MQPGLVRVRYTSDVRAIQIYNGNSRNMSVRMRNQETALSPILGAIHTNNSLIDTHTDKSARSRDRQFAILQKLRPTGLAFFPMKNLPVTNNYRTLVHSAPSTNTALRNGRWKIVLQPTVLEGVTHPSPVLLTLRVKFSA